MSTPLPAEGRFGPAPPERRALPVVQAEGCGPYVLLTLEDPGGPAPAPGQFYMLATVEGWGGGADERPFLPRAISVMDCAEGRLRFLLEDVGPGTARLCACRPGEQVLTLGPLGHGFRPAAVGRPVVCAGGIGVAPMVALCASLGSGAETILGFRDAAHAQAAGLFASASIATDDGSRGHHGTAVDLLAGALGDDPQATVYACGPPAMLEAVRSTCAQHGAAAQLALESGMACGYGACYGCVVPVAGGGYRRVCVDGPVLDGEGLAAGWEAACG